MVEWMDDGGSDGDDQWKNGWVDGWWMDNECMVNGWVKNGWMDDYDDDELGVRISLSLHQLTWLVDGLEIHSFNGMGWECTQRK